MTLLKILKNQNNKKIQFKKLIKTKMKNMMKLMKIKFKQVLKKRFRLINRPYNKIVTNKLKRLEI